MKHQEKLYSSKTQDSNSKALLCTNAILKKTIRIIAISSRCYFFLCLALFTSLIFFYVMFFKAPNYKNITYRFLEGLITEHATVKSPTCMATKV